MGHGSHFNLGSEGLVHISAAYMSNAHNQSGPEALYNLRSDS